MPWLKLKLRADRTHAEALGEALEEAGAISVSLEDAADEPLLELAWEAAPTWTEMFVTALFPANTDVDALLDRLKTAGKVSEPVNYECDAVPDQDWERIWMDRWQPMQVGRRLWIVPSWHTPPDPQAVNVVLDPGLAFGTGTHPTTALCLEWLAEQSLSGKCVIDIGCGSGILAVAALKLGAARAIATDIDARALAVTRENAERNGVAERLEALLPEELADSVQADVVIANILAGALVELAPMITGHTLPGGQLALSGIMVHQGDEVRAAYDPAFELTLRTRDEWALLAGRRRTV
jgi:ribosomal protein L11 methyltransferase